MREDGDAVIVDRKGDEKPFVERPVRGDDHIPIYTIMVARESDFSARWAVRVLLLTSAKALFLQQTT